eukprot:scaffold16.g104.t1
MNARQSSSAASARTDSAAASRLAARRWMWMPPPRPRRRRCSVPAPLRAAVGDDLDVAVFRFTLGIPGFDDALIPRVAGAVGAALLLANHLLSEGPPSDAQLRTEVLGALLAAVCIAAPGLEQRIKELDPGRGRRPPPAALEGAAPCFAELAWASYALLKNTNICGLVIVWRGTAVLCRGLLGTAAAAAGGGDASLAAISRADLPLQAAKAGSNSSSGGSGGSGSAYWEDGGAVWAAGAAGWALVPEGAQGVLVQPLAASGSSGGEAEGALVLLCDRPHALGSKEQAWAAALGRKVAAALSRLG